jgi:hypothetical protein
LRVIRREDELITRRAGSPEFRVKRVTGDWVRQEATEIGEDTAFATALGQCDCPFEIHFDNLDEVLDEINTLMEVQTALQDASQGILFLPWNGNPSEPWKE